MTAPVRIHQNDISRAAKAVTAAGLERARIVMDLANQRIEIIIGEPIPPPLTGEQWSDDDV